MNINLLKLYASEFKKREKKTALITFAIGWGALSLLLLMSFGRGLSNQFRIGASGLGVDLIMFTGGQTSKLYQGLPKGRRVRLYPDDIDLLRKQIPEIKLVTGEYYTNMTLKYKGKETNRTVNGVEPAFGILRSTQALLGGRFINDLDNKGSRRVVFLGWKLANQLFKGENPVGKVMKIQNQPFTVIGVMKKKLQMGNYQGLAYDQAYIPFSTFSNLYAQDFVDRIHIQPIHKKYSRMVEERAREVLGRKYRFDYKDNYAVGCWNTIDNGETREKVFVGIEIFLAIIGGLTLLIGAVGVTNLMYATVKERTNEIGVKMALGARRRHVVMQFMLEALMIFVKGTSWGVMLAFNIVSLIRLIPMSFEMASIQSYLLRPDFAPDILLAFIGAMGIIVFIAGIFPALKASKQNPVDALRYE